MAEETKETDKAETATAETKEAPQAMTVDSFNRAMSARERRLEKKIEDLLASKLAPPAKEEEEPTEEVAAPVPTQPTPAETAAKRALAKAKELEKRAKESEERAAKEKVEILAKEERTATLAALSAAGVKTTKAALAILKEDKRVTRNKDGDLVFLVTRGTGADKYEEELPLEEGVKEWLNTDDGKLFQPPRGVEGSGASASRSSSQGRTATREERLREASSILMRAFMGRKG